MVLFKIELVDHIFVNCVFLIVINRHIFSQIVSSILRTSYTAFLDYYHASSNIRNNFSQIVWINN